MSDLHHAAIPAEYVLDCYWQLDLDLRLEYASPAAAAMFGIPADALMGSPLGDHTDAADLGRMRERLAMALAADDRTRSFIHRFRVQHADGRLIPVEVHSRLLLDPEGEPHAIIGLARDISDREERLARARLREHHRMLAQKHQALASLAGDLLDHMEALHAQLDGEHPDRQHLAADPEPRLQQLRIIARRLPLEKQELSLDDIIQRVLDDIRVTLPEDLALIHQPWPGHVKVRADGQQLEAAVEHLCRYAASTMSGGGVIRVTTSLQAPESPDSTADAPPGAPPPARAVITVSDTGPGLTRDQRDRILDPVFGQDDEGLRLPLAASIANLHGGGVDVVSQPGGGTTVTLILPATHGAAPQSRPAPEVQPSCRVLVVDDDPEIRRYVGKVLQSGGFTTVICEDGVEALALIAGEEPFDAVVLDWALPGLDGRRVREQLQARHPRTPLLVISGHHRQQYEALGGVTADTPWLMKPFTPSALLRTLKNLLDRSVEAHGS